MKMNKTQVKFLFTLRSSIEQAQQSKDRIIAAVELGVADPEVCLEYIEALQKYIESALSMAWCTQISFGAGSRVIASQALEHRKQSES
jgi:hypothetical protein